MAEDRGQAQPRAGTFGELGVSGLDIWSGVVVRDPEASLQGQRGIDQYDLMRLEDNTVAAVMGALSLPIRRAVWKVTPASDGAGDREAAEFVESCLDDMSLTLDELLGDVCTMFAFGWSWFEWVLKRRNGRDSTYTDGRVGWRKIALRGQTSLDHWETDAGGTPLGMWQLAPTQARPVLIPIEKSLLFRTAHEQNNPEGLSVLRAAWRDWSFKRNLERIEAIGLQRALAGVPVVKLEPGATTRSMAGEVSDEAHAEEIITGLHSNKALGVIEHGALTFRFETPKMQGLTGDSDRVIRRKDEGIARSVLAMFILLGTKAVGSWALSKELGDLFFLSVEAYLGNIASVLTRFGVPVLMRYNALPGVTQYPRIEAEINRRVDLQLLASFINQTVGARVLTPDDELEKHIRELADLPEMPVELEGERAKQAELAREAQEAQVKALAEGGDSSPERSGAGDRRPTTDDGGTGQRVRERKARAGEVDRFARGASRERQYHGATDAYTTGLQSQFDAWAGEAADDLVDVDPENALAEFMRKLDDRLLVGLLLLKERGWAELPAAFVLGFGRPAGPEQRKVVDREIQNNDHYLEFSLFADIRGTLEGRIAAILLLLKYEPDEARGELRALLGSFRSRVGMYGGQYWHTIMVGIAERKRQDEEQQAEPAKRRVRWVLDPIARHCAQCPKFAREYASMEALLGATGGILPGQGTQCDGYCRCHLEEELESGDWVWM